MLVRIWSKENPSALLVGMRIGAATVENSMEVHQKLNVELPYDSAIPLLGIYPKKHRTIFQKGICTPMFIAALFSIAKEATQVSINNECLKKVWYTYTMEFYLAIKKKKILTLCNSMDGPGEYYAK